MGGSVSAIPSISSVLAQIHRQILWIKEKYTGYTGYGGYRMHPKLFEIINKLINIFLFQRISAWFSWNNC